MPKSPPKAPLQKPIHVETLYITAATGQDFNSSPTFVLAMLIVIAICDKVEISEWGLSWTTSDLISGFKTLEGSIRTMRFITMAPIRGYVMSFHLKVTHSHKGKTSQVMVPKPCGGGELPLESQTFSREATRTADSYNNCLLHLSS